MTSLRSFVSLLHIWKLIQDICTDLLTFTSFFPYINPHETKTVLGQERCEVLSCGKQTHHPFVQWIQNKYKSGTLTPNPSLQSGSHLSKTGEKLRLSDS